MGITNRFAGDEREVEKDLLDVLVYSAKRQGQIFALGDVPCRAISPVVVARKASVSAAHELRQMGS